MRWLIILWFFSFILCSSEWMVCVSVKLFSWCGCKCFSRWCMVLYMFSESCLISCLFCFMLLLFVVSCCIMFVWVWIVVMVCLMLLCSLCVILCCMFFLVFRRCFVSWWLCVSFFCNDWFSLCRCWMLVLSSSLVRFCVNSESNKLMGWLCQVWLVISVIVFISVVMSVFC